MTTYRAQYGERVAEIRPVRATPFGWSDEDTFYRIELDGDDLPGLHVYVDDAQRAAEERVGHALTWEVSK